MTKKKLCKIDEESKKSLWALIANALAPHDEIIRRAERDSRTKNPIKAHPEAHSDELDDTGLQRFIYTRPTRHLGSI